MGASERKKEGRRSARAARAKSMDMLEIFGCMLCIKPFGNGEVRLSYGKSRCL